MHDAPYLAGAVVEIALKSPHERLQLGHRGRFVTGVHGTKSVGTDKKRQSHSHFGSLQVKQGKGGGIINFAEQNLAMSSLRHLASPAALAINSATVVAARQAARQGPVPVRAVKLIVSGMATLGGY